MSRRLFLTGTLLASLVTAVWGNAPQNVRLSVATPANVFAVLTWDAVPNAAGYEIWQGTSTELSSAIPVATNQASGRIFQYNALDYRQPTWFWVRAFHGSSPDEFARSNPIQQPIRLWQRSAVRRFEPVVTTNNIVLTVATTQAPAVGARRMELLALDPQTGVPLWQHELPAAAGDGGVITPTGRFCFGTLVDESMGTATNRLYAWNLDGTLQWSVPISWRPRELISDSGGNLYNVDSGSSFRLRSVTADGELGWVNPSISGLQPPIPVIDRSGTILWGASVGASKRLLGLARSGGTLWERVIPDPPMWIAASSPGRAVALVPPNLVRFDAADGAGLFASENLRCSISVLPPVVDAAGNSYVIDPVRGTIFSYTESGTVRWTNTLPKKAISSGMSFGPCLDQSGRLLYSVLNTVYAVDTRDGTGIAWLVDANNILANPVLTADGILLLVTASGNLEAFRSSSGLAVDAHWPVPRGNLQGTSSIQVGPMPRPEQVVNLAAALYLDRLVVSWKNVDQLAAYEVWRGTNLDQSTARLVARSAPAVNRFVDQGTLPAETVHYWVRATSVAGAGPFSEPLTTARPSERVVWTTSGSTAPSWHSKIGVIVGNIDELICLDRNGRTQWTKDIGSSIVGPPVFGADGRVYVATAGQLVALNSKGDIQWAFDKSPDLLGGNDYLAPALGPDGTIYAGEGNKRIVALSQDGSVKWRSEAQSFTYSMGAAIGSHHDIFAVTLDGRMNAISEDGLTRWSVMLGDGAAYQYPIVRNDGSVWTVTYNGLIGVAPGGAINQSLPSSPGSQPLFLDDSLVLSAWNVIDPVATSKIVRYYGLRRLDGSVGWQREGVYSTATAAADGVIYFATERKLWAVAENGDLLWSYEFQEEGVVPLLTPDGRLYLTRGSFLDAIDVGRTPLVTAWGAPRHDFRGTANIGAQPLVGLEIQRSELGIELRRRQNTDDFWLQSSDDLFHWRMFRTPFELLQSTNRPGILLRPDPTVPREFLRGVGN